ncbi:serine hydrolase domain-containing protein [Bacteroidota bacterium]
MTKNFLFPFLILAFIITAIILLSGTSRESQQLAEPAVPVYSSFDSLLFSYDTIISRHIDSSGTVGAAIAIVKGDQIIFMKCFGVRDATQQEPVDRYTIFRLASVSKTITGMLAGILDAENILCIDEKVQELIPGFSLKDSVNTYDLDVGHLLSHTSGLVPHAYDNLVEEDVPFPIIIDSLFRVNISAEPGKLYGYQNVLFNLYDSLCHIKDPGGYDHLLQRKVFDPFGMTNASTGFAAFSGNENKAIPHGRYNGNFRPLSLNDRYYSPNPAAGINASIWDMANFLRALNETERSVVDASIKDSVFTPRVYTPLKWHYLRHWDRIESRHYGLGWRIVGYKGRNIAYHGGYVRGYQAEIAYCDEEELGIVFLTNSPNGVASQVVPSFLELYFGMSDAPKEVKQAEAPLTKSIHP